MPVIRPTALRSLQSSLRPAGARATARTLPRRAQLIARRHASSGSHGHGEASSDLPWMLGALIITPPACWYLWPDTTHAEHHDAHGDHEQHAETQGNGDGDEEAKSDGEKPAEKQPEEAASEAPKKPESSEGEGQSESKEKEDGAEDKTEQKEGGSEQRGNEVEGVQFKGKMKEGSAGYADERKTEPRPSKGTQVRRVDSGLGKDLGKDSTDDEDEKGSATSKVTGSSQGDITQKQQGLSTTDTRHSIQIDQHDDKSTKGTGEPETAKANGTVDPSSPITGGPRKN